MCKKNRTFAAAKVYQNEKLEIIRISNDGCFRYVMHREKE